MTDWIKQVIINIKRIRFLLRMYYLNLKIKRYTRYVQECMRKSNKYIKSICDQDELINTYMNTNFKSLIDNLQEVECLNCKNKYFIGQVEFNIKHDKPIWICPNCSLENKK